VLLNARCLAANDNLIICPRPYVVLIKKYIIAVTSVIAINYLTYFFFLPYVQKTENSHVGNGTFFGVVYYLGAILTTILAVRVIANTKDFKFFGILFLFTCSLLYWGHTFYSLYCLGCANSG
jgi:hypothetical protein